MLAFTDRIVSRAEFLAELRAHRAADRIVQGAYWEDGRGCAIACSIEIVNRLAGRYLAPGGHAALAEAIGVPAILLILQDGIFRGLPAMAAPDWPVQFYEAIAQGMDLSPVAGRFLARMLREIVAPTVSGPRVVLDRVALGWETGWQNDDPNVARLAEGPEVRSWAALAASTAVDAVTCPWTAAAAVGAAAKAHATKGRRFGTWVDQAARVAEAKVEADAFRKMAGMLLSELRACR